MKTFTFLSFSLILFFFACNAPQKEDATQNDSLTSNSSQTEISPDTSTFAGKLAQAHRKSDFISKEAIVFDIVLSFGGKERLNGKMTLLSNSTKGLIALKDGNKIYYDGDKVFHSPKMENTKGVRFAAFTWSYFFLFPYKLTDPGTQWTDYESDTLNGKSYLTEKLTFDDGVGDSPKDWYIVYANPENKLIEVASYIVTLGQRIEEAEKDPHAIQYSKYENIEGIPIATQWTFWAWKADKGLEEQLGEATLSNLAFIKVQENAFTPPNDFLEAK